MQFFWFSAHWGFFAGHNGIVGHELLHKKELVNKIAGTWAYTKFLYSHFLDEHIKGHHKYLGTDEDPATADKNETFYHFIFKSAIGSHVQCWKREVQRIKKQHGDDCGIFY
jgi:alkane 1-monooxygenase